MAKEIKFDIPAGTEPSRCRGCGASIYWLKMASGKNMPVDPDGVSHFATCARAAQFRKPPDDFQKKQCDNQRLMVEAVKRHAYDLNTWEADFIRSAEAELDKGKPLTKERASKLLEIYEAKS